jgi:hypothetical protein
MSFFRLFLSRCFSLCFWTRSFRHVILALAAGLPPPAHHFSACSASSASSSIRVEKISPRSSRFEAKRLKRQVWGSGPDSTSIAAWDAMRILHRAGRVRL